MRCLGAKPQNSRQLGERKGFILPGPAAKIAISKASTLGTDFVASGSNWRSKLLGTLEGQLQLATYTAVLIGFTGATTVYTGSSTSYSPSGKTAGTYYYRVLATNTLGSSGWTAGSNGCLVTAPTPPATLTVPATSSSGNYTVSWTSSTGATSYTLEEDTSSTFTAATTVYTGTNLSYAVTGKVSGTWIPSIKDAECATSRIRNARDSKAARAISFFVVAPVNPTIAARSSGALCGAPSP